MRNGKSDYYNHSNNFSFLIKLILIILCGFILYHILTLKKSNVTLEINPVNLFSNIIIKPEEIIMASLYKEQIPINNLTAQQCANTFINADAMVIGDSTAEGLTAYGILYDSSVVWTRGRTIQYMEADLEKVLANQPSVLFLAYGANDLLSWNGNVEGYINAYSRILDSLSTSLPNTKICVNSILPVSDTALANNPEYTYQPEFNKRLKELCASRGVTFVENGDLLKQNNGGKQFESDGVHPKPFYYKLWANNMIEVAGL